MRGDYSHVSESMRKALTDTLQKMWEASLDERLKVAPRSPVGILDALLQERTKANKQRKRGKRKRVRKAA
jgi:Arc/MetJ-type ribon-helix-helix transcriptional regulator